MIQASRVCVCAFNSIGNMIPRFQSPISTGLTLPLEVLTAPGGQTRPQDRVTRRPPPHPLTRSIYGNPWRTGLLSLWAHSVRLECTVNMGNVQPDIVLVTVDVWNRTSPAECAGRHGTKTEGSRDERAPPPSQRERVNKGTARGLFICPITPILWAAARARATLSRRGGGENSGFSARLRNPTVSAAPPAFLPHPETTSKRLQRARRRGKRKKKKKQALSRLLKINKVGPSELYSLIALVHRNVRNVEESSAPPDAHA